MNGIASNCHGIKTPSIFTMPSNFLRYGQVTVRTINWPKHMAIWKNKTNLHTIAAKKIPAMQIQINIMPSREMENVNLYVNSRSETGDRI